MRFIKWILQIDSLPRAHEYPCEYSQPPSPRKCYVFLCVNEFIEGIVFHMTLIFVHEGMVREGIMHRMISLWKLLKNKWIYVISFPILMHHLFQQHPSYSRLSKTRIVTYFLSTWLIFCLHWKLILVCRKYVQLCGGFVGEKVRRSRSIKRKLLSQ